MIPCASAALETSPCTVIALPPAAVMADDDRFRAGLARCIVDDDGRALGGEQFRDRRADAFRGPRDDGDLA